MEPGGCAAGNRAARDEQDPPAPTISRPFTRSGSAARRCRRSRPSRTSLLRTRARGQPSGTEIRVNGGVVGVGDGGRAPPRAPSSRSTISSTTCRRAESSSSRTAPESAQVSRMLTQLALAYPEVGFTLTSGGRRVLQCPPASRRFAIASTRSTVNATISSRLGSRRAACG